MVCAPNITANSTSNSSSCDPVNHEQFEFTNGKIFSVIGIAILIVTALIGNMFVCVSFYRYRRLHTVTNYFIVSLAISDIMVSAFSMPLWLSYEATGWEQLPAWMSFEVLYSFYQCIDILACVSSIANLAAISLDRLFSIIAPLRHRIKMTPVVALIMIAFAWLYALTISLCSLTRYTHFTFISATFGFFLPLLVIVSSYLGIYIQFRIRSSRQGTLVRNWNLERTLLIVISLFVICWLPFIIRMIMIYQCLMCVVKSQAHKYFGWFATWMHYLNSCCNPIVYGYFNSEFKAAFWELLGSCCSKRYSDMNHAACSREMSNSEAGTVLCHLDSIKRKLSWKREVEESIVSNGGEVNDNSLSLAMLALQLKDGRSPDSPESCLLTNEWSSAHESSGDEVVVNKCQKVPFNSWAESNSIQSKSMELKNEIYDSVYEDNQSQKNANSDCSVGRLEFIGSDIVPVNQEETNLGTVDIDEPPGEDFLNRNSSQPIKWLDEIEPTKSNSIMIMEANNHDNRESIV